MGSKFTTGLRAALAALAIGGWAPLTAQAGAAPSPAVTMLSQSTTVEATLSGQSTFSMSLSMPNVPADTKVATTLFSHLTTRSGFLAALSTQGPSNQIDSTEPLPVSCLTAGPKSSFTIAIDVLTSAATEPTLPGGCAGAAHGPTYTLRCTVGSGGCNGVYPLLVTVTGGGRIISRFVTFMTYVEHPTPTPLRVATVLHITDAHAETPANVRALVHGLRASPAAATDLAISPRAVQRLSSTVEGTDALGRLGASIQAASSTREVVASPYVSVDPGELAASALQDQIRAQLRRGRQILVGGGLPPGTLAAGWLATSPVTSSTTNALSSAGINRLVIPDSSLSQPTATSLTWGQPFSTTPGTTSVTSIAADPILAGEMRSGNDPVLAAQRFLADIAFLHFERPSLTTPQCVVAVTPQGWVPNQAFLTSLLSGLTNNPVATASTLSGLFTQVPVGANGAPKTRTLADAGPATSWPDDQSTELRSQQKDQAAFAGAVVGGHGVVGTLRDSLLRSESDLLANDARSEAISTTESLLTTQLESVQIGGGDITLTALKGSLPLTLTKSAPYKVIGVLTLHSDHLRFPRGDHYPIVIGSTTKSLRIPVQAITTGDLPLTATLRTPTGSLVIAHQRVLIHTTQSSIVAIFLTLGAAIVLLAWWVRTWWRKPRSRHSRR